MNMRPRPAGSRWTELLWTSNRSSTEQRVASTPAADWTQKPRRPSYLGSRCRARPLPSVRSADGTVLWMASPEVIESRIAPRLHAVGLAAGRPTPRNVAGLPVAVHDDLVEARSAQEATAAVYAGMPNYQRILDEGGATTPAEVAIVGHEASVRKQLRGLIDAGATDVWAHFGHILKQGRPSCRPRRQGRRETGGCTYRASSSPSSGPVETAPS